MNNSLKLGISTCLLGEKVRYDGGHKLDRYLKDTLGQFVQWVPVCPEVECGLTVPREAMRLIGTENDQRLVTQKSGIDLTPKMLDWSKIKLKELASLNLCGFIFKSKSPSSGMQRVKLYNQNGGVTKKGIGIFAKEFMEKFPMIPVEDDGRLHDLGLRENFIERIFVFKRWLDLINNFSAKGLINFHSEHKLLIMAHSPKALKELGSLISDTKNVDQTVMITTYGNVLINSLKLIATKKKNTNVLQHCMGYFKKILSKDEKAELLNIIIQYHEGLIPLIAPVILLQHYSKKYEVTYLLKQHYLHPHPIELMLRNHV